MTCECTPARFRLPELRGALDRARDLKRRARAAGRRPPPAVTSDLRDDDDASPPTPAPERLLT